MIYIKIVCKIFTVDHLFNLVLAYRKIFFTPMQHLAYLVRVISKECGFGDVNP